MAIDLLKLQEKLGYSVNKGGMCYGIAYMAIQAIIRDDLERYISRINYLEKTLLQHNNNQDDAIDEIVEKINAAYEKRKNKQNLDSEEIKLLDILNWLDGVQIYFNQNKLFSDSQNYEIATNFFSANTNQEEKENRKIFVIAKELNMLTEKLINDIFDKIDNSKDPIAFSLSSVDHIISIGKSSNYMPIYLISHDIHKHITSSRHLYSEVIHAFNYSLRTALSIMTYSYQEANISIKYVTNNLDKDDLPKLLCIALKEGHPEAIKAYIGCISNLRGINKQELLAAKKPNGIPGLFMALQNGHSEAVKAYIEGIFNFDGINKQELLAAKSKDVTPGLYMSLYNGHSEAVKVYIECISNFDGIDKQELLAAKTQDGTPGLCMALQDGHSEAIKVYIECISKFAGINKQELLAAKIQDDGTPGLFMALQEGQSAAIKAYIESISNLVGIDKQELLAAKTQGDEIPGLFMSLYDGHSEAVKVYIEGISKFDGIDKQELLAAKIPNGTPGLHIALQNGHSEAIKAYIEGISNIAGIDKQELLAAKIPDGTPGLHIALQKGHLEAVKIYKETISKFMVLNNGSPRFLP
ncbi:ankyrin repeat domain-containing protein [Francisella hispaniensis]|uniref:hypothetical protein n=1 Tax=Francisella hispaniensis TaxID=622488 RepID=UPI0019061210|nr:hypothetical protein [Francisella hispaniensis]MBK2356673.1 hypothetical protein [Francisella hispaniensis]